MKDGKQGKRKEAAKVSKRVDQGHLLAGADRDPAAEGRAVVPGAKAPAARAGAGEAAPTIEGLILQAVKTGQLDTLERMMALRREMKAESGRDAFFQSLARFQARCPVIRKTRSVFDKQEKGGKLRYKFAPLDEIVRQVKNLLVEEGFSYTLKAVQAPKAVKAVMELHHDAGHSEVTTFSVPIQADSFMTDVQKVGAAMTFAKRYAFCNALGIMTGEEDTDAVGTGAASENGHKAELPKPAATVPEGASLQQAVKVVHDTLAKMSWLPEKTRAMYIGQVAKYAEAKDVRSLTGLASSLSRQITLKKLEKGAS